MTNPPFRIGQGYDIHRLAPGRNLILGGVPIPSDVGLEGHSDADVVIHALCDAILGATGNGDIGQHFPNTDPKWKGTASTVFLKAVLQMTAEGGYAVSNVDISLLAERPKLGPYFPAMRDHLAEVCGIPQDCVGLKATTNEKLGAIGRGEGIAAFAVVLLVARPRG